MSKLQGEILTFPKISGSVSTPKSLNGSNDVIGIDLGEVDVVKTLSKVVL